MKTFFVLAGLVVASALAFAGDSLRSAILVVGKPIERALMHKDVAAFAKAVRPNVTDDFTYSDAGGKPMDFDTMVQEMKQSLSAYTKITLATSRIVSVKQKGDTGAAVERHEMKGYTLGPDKKKHNLVFIGTSTESYKKVGGKWLMSSMVMKTDKLTMDGKPMSMGGQ